MEDNDGGTAILENDSGVSGTRFGTSSNLVFLFWGSNPTPLPASEMMMLTLMVMMKGMMVGLQNGSAGTPVAGDERRRMRRRIRRGMMMEMMGMMRMMMVMMMEMNGDDEEEGDDDCDDADDEEEEGEE